MHALPVPEPSFETGEGCCALSESCLCLSSPRSGEKDEKKRNEKQNFVFLFILIWYAFVFVCICVGVVWLCGLCLYGVCMCVCVCSWLCLPVREPGRPEVDVGVSSSIISLPYFLRQALSLNPQLMISPRAAGHWFPGMLLILCP